MKGKQRIKLLKSQKILLQTKNQETMNLIQVKRNEIAQILNVIMIDQGVPEKDVGLWKLSADGQAIEKIDKKPPKEKKDKKKKGEGEKK